MMNLELVNTVNDETLCKRVKLTSPVSSNSLWLIQILLTLNNTLNILIKDILTGLFNACTIITTFFYAVNATSTKIETGFAEKCLKGTLHPTTAFVHNGGARALVRSAFSFNSICIEN